MPPFSLLHAAANLPQRHLRKGSALYRTGDKCDDNIYVVMDGTLVRVNRDEAFVSGSEISKGGLVGDIEVMSGATERVQTYKAKSEVVTLAILDKRAAHLIGSLHPEFFLILLRSSIDSLTAAEQELLTQPIP